MVVDPDFPHWILLTSYWFLLHLQQSSFLGQFVLFCPQKYHVLFIFKQNIAKIAPFMTATAYLVDWYPVLWALFLSASLFNSLLSMGLYLSKFVSFSNSFKLFAFDGSRRLTAFSTSFPALQAKFQVNSVHYLHSILKKVKSKSCFGSTPSPQAFCHLNKSWPKRDQPIRSKDGQFISH